MKLAEILKKYWFPLVLWIVALLWFSLFSVEVFAKWDIPDLPSEGISFLASVVGYIIIRKLRIRNLEIGWVIITTGLFIHFLREFTAEPVIIANLEGIAVALGVILVATGICKATAYQKRVEKEIRAERDLLQTLMDNIPDYIYFKDEKNRFVKVNRARAKIAGTTPDEMIGKTDFDFFPEEEAKKTSADDNYVKQSGKPIVGKVEELTFANGKKHWVSVTKIPWYGQEGRIVGTIGISRDITEHKKMEEKLRELSRRDYLTGLFNDRYFYEKLREEMDRFKRYGEIFSLIYIDIDSFKTCNDTYGHLEGDKVLRILSKILQRSLRKVDSAYRIGGEEFVVMLPHTSKEEAGKVAQRICEDVHQRLYPRYGITVSIGVADSRKVDDLVRTADEAMYEAKRRGKNRVWVAE